MIESQESFHVNGQTTGAFVRLGVDQQPRESIVGFQHMSTKRRELDGLALAVERTHLRTT